MLEISNRKISGIYKILNKKNNKFYIGSAKSLYYRKSTHFSLLKKNNHFNKKMQNSFNKNGIEFFEFIIIEICSIDELITKEQYYIDILNPYFNICKNARSILGVKRSEETKKKMSLNHKRHNLGKKFSDEIRKNMSIGQKYRKPPSDETKLKTSNSLKGIRFTDERKKNISIALTGRKLSKEALRKRIEKQYKPIIFYSSNGDVIKEFKSIKEAKSNSELSLSTIRKLLKGLKSKKYNLIIKYK